jgi:hypothetical protein
MNSLVVCSEQEPVKKQRNHWSSEQDFVVMIIGAFFM